MVSGTTLWEYAALAAIAFVLPLAFLVCAGIASGGVSPRLRSAGLVLLAVGVLVLLRQVLRTGVGDLMPLFAIPTLVAAAVVYPLAALALVRSVRRSPAASRCSTHRGSRPRRRRPAAQVASPQRPRRSHCSGSRRSCSSRGRGC